MPRPGSIEMRQLQCPVRPGGNGALKPMVGCSGSVHNAITGYKYSSRDPLVAAGVWIPRRSPGQSGRRRPGSFVTRADQSTKPKLLVIPTALWLHAFGETI
jgi:hypothetical protein